ncbi:MAG TPA: NADH:ubiquinone reductase (Na(+)-transporting) subunit A, partial [Bacteroidales bacterium]|nr:NADH:ubiquinone reductase (Na(+)-transporting) subunit A [Bacteroidales bacterium]
VYEPRYYRCVAGIQLSALLKGNVHKEIPLRYISGNALTGTRVEMNDYLGAYDSQVTVLHEGTDVHEFAGWVMPRLNMFSMSKTYFTGLVQKICPRKQFDADTRILGGERALIMSGEYEKVFPMDILPEKLVRACITRDLEKMEELGIYEVAPEDFALCEYVCTSKVEVQRQVRAALDLLKAENGEE